MSFAGKRYDFRDQTADYARLAEELGGLLSGERDFVANAANTAALIYDALPDLNWAGFYFLKQGELVVGPFQGKPACVRIALGKGVCGSAAAQRKTIVVPDVEAFPGILLAMPPHGPRSWCRSLPVRICWACWISIAHDCGGSIKVTRVGWNGWRRCSSPAFAQRQSDKTCLRAPTTRPAAAPPREKDLTPPRQA